MITIQMQATIDNATPGDVFHAVSDPQGLKTLLPRMKRIDHTPLGHDRARVVMHISIGSIFGTIPCDGILSWVEPREILFRVTTPLPVENRWVLTGDGHRTHLDINLWLDLAPFLGTMTRYVPQQIVKDMMRKELTHAVHQIPRRLREQRHEQQLMQPSVESAWAA